MAVNDDEESKNEGERRQHELRIENLKGTIDLAKEGLRALHLANGGAVVALMTFYGNIAAKGSASTIAVDQLACALNRFAWGLIAGLVTSAIGYLSQLEAATKRDGGGEILYRYLALVFAAISLGLFAIGTYQAGESFTVKAAATTMPAKVSTPRPTASAILTPALPTRLHRRSERLWRVLRDKPSAILSFGMGEVD